MDPIKIAHLLGLSEDLSDPSKESNTLSDWISRAIHDCKHKPQSSPATKKPLPTTSQLPTKTSQLDLMVGSVKKAVKPDDKYTKTQEIDRVIINLEDSDFKEDIENLRILKLLYQTIIKLDELKSAIQENPSFKFNDLSPKNPLGLLIHAYDKDLSIAEFLKNPQQLVSGKTSTLDKLIKDLSLSKQTVVKSVHQAEQKRIEKAKSLILNGDGGVTRDIESFGILDQTALIEIAKIAAARPASRLALYITDFHITDSTALAEIAKIMAAIPGLKLSAYIDNFNITEESLFQIAIIEMRANNADVDLYDYKFSDEKKIFLLKTLQTIYKITTSNTPSPIPVSVESLRPFLTAEAYASFLPEAESFFADLDKELLTAKAANKTFAEIHVERQKHLYLFLLLSAPDKPTFDSLKPSMSRILNFRNKELAIELAIALSNILSSPIWTKHYQSHIEASYMFLPMIFFTNLALEANADAASLDLVMKQLSHIDKTMKKDEAKLSFLLQPLAFLESNNALPPKEKFTLLLQLLKIDTSLTNVIKILGVLASANLLAHPDLKVVTSFEELNSIFVSLLQTELFHFEKDSLIKDFITKYPKISEQSRVPFGLEIYSANIGKLHDKALIECLQMFVISLCNNSFKEMRYNVENNPHLKVMDRSILARWKETANHAFKETLPPNLIAVTSDDWQDLFFSGTEVQGSCQHINGSTDLNKGLLDYVVNGTNQLLAIKDKSTNKIKSRCILRLLLVERVIDGAKKLVPVLFREALYPEDSVPKDHEIALKNMANKRAEELGLELFSEDEERFRKPEILQSFGGNAPWGYVDANWIGATEDGRFSIQT